MLPRCSWKGNLGTRFQLPGPEIEFEYVHVTWHAMPLLPHDWATYRWVSSKLSALVINVMRRLVEVYHGAIWEKLRVLLLGWHLNNSNCTNMDASEVNARIRCLSLHFYHCKDGFGCNNGLTTGDGSIPFCPFRRKMYDPQCEFLYIRPIYSRLWDALLVVKSETVRQHSVTRHSCNNIIVGLFLLL